MNENNRKFQDYATSSAFQLNLSSNMIGFLIHVHQAEQLAGGSTKYEDQPEFMRFEGSHGICNHATPGRALERRGLIYSPLPEWPGIFHLTEAGKLVFQLLKIAELIKPVDCPELEKT